MKRNFIFLLLVVSACSYVKVVSDRDPAVDFQKFKTFNFSPLVESPNVPPEFNQLNQKRIRSAIAKEMESRSLTQAQSPELMVSIFLRVAEKQKVVGSSGYYGGPYYYGHYSGYNSGSVHTVDYKVGTLVIDVVEVPENKLVWQGIAEGTLASRPSKNIEARIQKVVKKIFDKYPTAPVKTEKTS